MVQWIADNSLVFVLIAVVLAQAITNVVRSFALDRLKARAEANAAGLAAIEGYVSRLERQQGDLAARADAMQSNVRTLIGQDDALADRARETEQLVAEVRKHLGAAGLTETEVDPWA